MRQLLKRTALRAIADNKCPDSRKPLCHNRHAPKKRRDVFDRHQARDKGDAQRIRLDAESVSSGLHISWLKESFKLKAHWDDRDLMGWGDIETDEFVTLPVADRDQLGTNAREGAFDSEIEASLMTTEVAVPHRAVIGMHYDSRTRSPRSDPADEAGLGEMGVHEVRLVPASDGRYSRQSPNVIERCDRSPERRHKHRGHLIIDSAERDHVALSHVLLPGYHERLKQRRIEPGCQQADLQCGSADI